MRGEGSALARTPRRAQYFFSTAIHPNAPLRSKASRVFESQRSTPASISACHMLRAAPPSQRKLGLDALRHGEGERREMRNGKQAWGTLASGKGGAKSRFGIAWGARTTFAERGNYYGYQQRLDGRRHVVGDAGRAWSLVSSAASACAAWSGTCGPFQRARYISPRPCHHTGRSQCQPAARTRPASSVKTW